MKRHWMVRVVKFLMFAAAAAVVLGFVVMSLWNRLLPGLFGWHMISFWQAVGLLILSRIFFGGLRRGGGWGPGMHWRRRMVERWEQMTPEEREKFRAGMRRPLRPVRDARAAGRRDQDLTRSPNLGPAPVTYGDSSPRSE